MMWIRQNTNKVYSNGQPSWWAEQAKKGHDIEWEIESPTDAGFKYTGRVRVDGVIMIKEQARECLSKAQPNVIPK